MTRARVLADLGNSGTFSANADTNRVGISSANPTATLDVTGDVNVSSAATFGGNVTVGGVLTYEDVTNVDSVGVLTARLGANISGGDGLKVTANGAQITGVSTFSSAIDANGDLDVDGQTDLDNLVVAGVSTFSSLIDLNAELDVDGQTDLDNLIVAGVSTFSADVSIADKIIHTGDTNTAIRFPAADTFAIETSGSERVRVTSAGLIGIGTETPETTLTVRGTSDGVLNLDTADSRGAFIRFGQGSSYHNMVGCADGLVEGPDKEDLGLRATDSIIFAAGGATERGRITSAGKIGIGLTNPLQTVVVKGTSDNGGNQYSLIQSDTSNATGGGGFEIAQNGTRVAVFAPSGWLNSNTGSDAALHVPTGKNFIFYNQTTEALRITSAGKVGIGTDSPSNFLHVKNYTSASNYITAENTTTGNAGVRLKNSQGDYAIFANDDLIFYDLENDVEKVRIDSSGRLLVNNTSTSNNGRLCVRGDAASATNGGALTLQKGAAVSGADQHIGTLSYGEGSANTAEIKAFTGSNWTGSSRETYLTFETTPSGSSGPTERLRINANGDLGINTTGGNYTVQMHEPSAGSFTLQMTTGAIGSANTSGARITASSSRKLFFENQENEDTLFYNNGGEKFVIKAGGDCSISDGNLILADGHGISFAATANGGSSTPSELLDDYEEGTFTPTISAGADDGSGGTPPFSIQAGRYIKIGKKVHCDIFIRFANGAFSTGAHARIGDLPFTISNDSYGNVGASNLTRGGGVSSFHNTTSDITTCYGNNGSAYFYLYKDGGTNFVFGGGNDVSLNGAYWIGIFEYISNI